MSYCIPLLNERSSQGSLRPVTTISCGRYDEKPGATLVPCVISPGMHTSSRDREPQYLPPYWSTHVHPEGQLYFCRSYPLRLVTEAYIYDPAILDKALYWAAKVEALLEEQNIKITDEMELFLHIKGEDCTYYLVDYASKTQFWAENMKTEDLDLYGALSPAHLKLHLQSLFWKHIEHFPMHSGALPLECVDELLSIFSHGFADKMTSTTSTFFYDKQQCKESLKLIKTARDYLDDGRQICLVARLWSTICDHRFSVHYGTQHCRLDRNKPVLWAEPEQVRWLSALFSRLSFGNYDTHLTRIHDLFCDRFLYAEQWRPFVTENIQEWREISIKASASLTLHLFTVFIPSSAVLGISSFGLFSASFLSSVLLIHRYKAMQNISVSIAREHILNIESAKFGFQFVALVSALPTAMWLWGLGFFFSNCLYSLGLSFGFRLAMIVSVICIIAFFSFQRATSDSRMSLSFSLPSFLRHRQTNGDIMV